MATRIRLRRVGRKKLPLYRIVVAEKTAPRDGRFIEVIGSYSPKAAEGKQVELDAEKARGWLARGATATETVESILRKAGVVQAKA
jgi:small subunit ribosomal protein S16